MEISSMMGDLYFMFFPKTSPFTSLLVQNVHDSYCGQDAVYGMSRLIKEQIFIPQVRGALTSLNRTCPKTCLERAITGQDRFKIHYPNGLGGTLQISATKDVLGRNNCVMTDLLGPFQVKCGSKRCLRKVYMIRHMSRFGRSWQWFSSTGK